MINIENEYLELMAGVLYGGKNKKDRTGTGTKSVFGRMLRHDMALGFPILTTKKIYFEKALAEILWIIQGRTDLKYLHDNNINYWDYDYKRSKRTDGTLGKIYGHQWRNFNNVDQFKKIITEIKKNPYSRRLMVSAWNPADMDDMVLPPCHHGFQIYINNKRMSLMWQQRSADIFLGLPYDIVMYGLLLEMLCKGLGYIPNQLIASLGDCHLYNNHLEQAKLQLSREPYALPKIRIDFGIDIREGANDFLFVPTKNMINLIKYKHYEKIKASLSY